MLVESYTFRAALEAKNILITECEKVSIVDSIGDFTVKRQDGKSGALRRVITDTVDIWTVIDREKKGELLVKFVAADPNQLPSANVDKFSLQFLVAAIAKLQEKIDVQDSILSHIRDRLDTPSFGENSSAQSSSVQSRKKGKRKLSGSAVVFTPKRHLSLSTAPSSELPAHTKPVALSELLASSVPSASLTALSPQAAASTAVDAPSTSLHATVISSLSLPVSTSDLIQDDLDSQLDLFSTQAAPEAPPPPPPPSTSSAPEVPKTKGNFADKAKNLKKNKNDWILVERKKRKIVPVTGSGAASGLEGVAPQKRDYWDVALQRLNADKTTESSIKSYLESKQIEVREVHIYPSTKKGSVTARVRVALKDKEQALDPSNFGPYIQVSSWIIKSKSARKTDAVSSDSASRQNGKS